MIYDIHTMRDGYDPNFLGVSIPLPIPSLEISDDVLEIDDLDSSPIVNYRHYSVMMSKSNKQAFLSAANLDRSKKIPVDGRSWFVDSRVGKENQITNTFYTSNVWDRGHLTRRTAVTWGDSIEDVRDASNDSCAYTNAVMQHKNFNQDEWRIVEHLADDADYVKDQKLSIFTGPIFTQTDRWYTRRSTDEKVRIPSGFWKLVAYIHAQTNELLVQGFVFFQDDESMLDNDGQKFLEVRQYQITTTELEMFSGLHFPRILYDANPLYFYPHDGVNSLPEGLGIPPGITERDWKNYLAIRAGETVDGLSNGQRNLTPENFRKMLSLSDH